MKKCLTYLLLFICFTGSAQQTSIYTQYLFNKAGMNPAASGTDINEKFNYVFGINRQWVGFDHAPKANFANFSMTIRPPRSYHLWQNVGVYIDNEQNGFFNNGGVYFNYTVHMLVRKKWVVSFGTYAGIRTFFVESGALDRNDPINKSADLRTLMYPDIIPGFRLSNRKFFFDFSLRHVSIFKLKDFKGNRIGGPSTLNQTLFADVGTLIPLSDVFMLVPSLALNTSVIGVPAVDLNVMVYGLNRIGVGAALRNADFMSVICQIRILKNVTAGLAYSYTLNMMRYAAPNSFEIMMGITPLGMREKPGGRHSIARCPTLDL